MMMTLTEATTRFWRLSFAVRKADDGTGLVGLRLLRAKCPHQKILTRIVNMLPDELEELGDG